MWFWLASHLHQSLARVMFETSARQFARWKLYRIQERNHFHREDYYLAQIAAEIRRANQRVRSPARVKTDQFLLKFYARGPMSSEDAEQHILHSKRAWLSAVGVQTNNLLVPGRSLAVQ